MSTKSFWIRYSIANLLSLHLDCRESHPRSSSILVTHPGVRVLQSLLSNLAAILWMSSSEFMLLWVVGSQTVEAYSITGVLRLYIRLSLLILSSSSSFALQIPVFCSLLPWCYQYVYSRISCLRLSLLNIWRCLLVLVTVRVGYNDVLRWNTDDVTFWWVESHEPFLFPTLQCI